MSQSKFQGLYQINRPHKPVESQQPVAKVLDKAEEFAGSVKMSNDDSLEHSMLELDKPCDNFEFRPSGKVIPTSKFKVPLKNHFRSQSCPFDLSDKPSTKKLHHHRSPSAIPEESFELPAVEHSETDSLAVQNKKLARISQRGLPFSKKKSCQSLKSVVIHNSDANNMVYISSMLYSEKKIAEQEQRRPAIKKASKRSIEKMLEDKFMLNKHRYLKMRLEQQMKRQQLNEDLLKVEKEAADIAVKQLVLESIMNRVNNNVDSSVVFY